MKHFIATRFNLKVEGWTTAKDGYTALTDEWLSDRFELFQAYCLPSVINQSNQNFYWAIYLDIDTPNQFKKMIEDLTKNHNHFFPMFIDGTKSLNASFKSFIESHLDHTDDYFINSRLDNDDAIHQDYVKTIQQLTIKKDKTIIDLRKGYQMNVTKNYYEYRNFEFSFNPFISLIEKSDAIETIFSKMHRDWKQADSIIVFNEYPLWIEVIHKSNKANEVKHNIPLTQNINFNEFGITKALKEVNSYFFKYNNLKVQLNNSTKLKKIKSLLK
ncbi:glycosyltransferase [Winogradskyella helgolandensis]|uniref:glycosyltransferase n=1 Tax=Winogradskyella helgolandensis TaxID=2697010 RepID=UPI0015BB56A7|nr:glycosyltransferase [Winogradskyella helgolandensis]